MVASSTNARVAVAPALDVYYKQFLPRGPLESLKALLKGSRATRARRHNDALRAGGFTAPENLAWGRLDGGHEYLFSRAVPGVGVTTWLREKLVAREGQALLRRRALLRELGVFIGQLHAAGFIHGDLRTSNVLADDRDGTFRFALIDNERNLQRLPPPGRGILRNLMQLNMLPPSDLSPRDRMRFFCAWRAQQEDLTRAEARLLAREAYAWATRRLHAKGKLP